MTPEQRAALRITVDRGLVAVETHNAVFTQKAKVIDGGIVEYILGDE
jgi:hypothetical protein